MTGKSGDTLEGLKSTVCYVVQSDHFSSIKLREKAPNAWPKALWTFDNNSGSLNGDNIHWNSMKVEDMFSLHMFPMPGEAFACFSYYLSVPKKAL